VIVQDNGQRKEMELHAGGYVNFHPAKPYIHRCASEGFIGLVIERKRSYTDGLLWFCG
jgi:3-hydroxyanthranilate 3,4-dioxygenase